ncbi:MAG TPA: hypothetical protein DHW71_13925 [Gammaproteobacteria bacterium]|nr:hypothetical protein [Gammaproteobacteria bacterium]HCK94089.1 hypothetical protein [Gammaproteobacteria bacterium]|tara:strand:+ start:262 stop:1101 length:840 start_codon:yes stop_codon:yes gene_type:complete
MSQPHKILFVSDLDGTLLRSDKTICQFSIDTMRMVEEAGHLFTIATARSHNSASRFLENLHLKTPIGLYNGAQIFDPLQETYLHAQYLSVETMSACVAEISAQGFRPIVHVLNKNQENRVLYIGAENASEKHYFSEKLKHDPKRFILCTPETIAERAAEFDVLEVMFITEHTTEYVLETPELKVYRSEDIYSPGFDWVQMTHPNSNKGFAVKKIAKMTGATHIISFGDNVNDVDMFAVSDISCAIKSGHDLALEMGDHIIGTNDEAGVAHWIRQYLSSL